MYIYECIRDFLTMNDEDEEEEEDERELIVRLLN